MENIWKKYKIWISFLVYVVFTGGIFFFGVMPIIKSIESRADEIQKKSIDNELNQTRIEKIPEMENLHQLFVQKSSDFEVIINPEDNVDFINKIEALAEETNNVVNLNIEENIANKKTSGKKDAEKSDLRLALPYDQYINLRIELEGDYPSLINFISKLENMDYYVNVVSVSVSKNKKEPVVSGGNSGQAVENGQTANISEAEVLKSTLDAVVYIKK